MPVGLLSRLIVSFVLAILCFCSSTFYSESISRHIDDAALSIANNAMPSIQQLADTRAELRHLEVAVVRWSLSRTVRNQDEVAKTRGHVDEAFERYLALPVFPGEQALWSTMHHALAGVDRAVAEALARPPQAPADTSHVAAAVNDASSAIRAAIQFNAARGGELALQIESGRLRSARVAITLDILSTLFTALAAYLTVRALMHHGRVVEERNQLVARRAEELEQFAGRVAHDILGPLSATKLAIGLVHAKVSDPLHRRSLERGERGIHRVATIVDGLLRFARAGAKPEPGVVTEVGPVAQSVVAELEPIAIAAEITLTLSAPPAGSVHAHAGVLSSVVDNLVRNAIKYMGERSERSVEVIVTADVRRVRIEVRDNGPGIAPALLPTLFDAHVRGRTNGQPGIGLGLATVKRIAESHGGRCGVQSVIGEGSRFFLELPRADRSDAAAPAAPATTTSATQSA